MSIKLKKFKDEHLAYNYLKIQIRELDYSIDEPSKIDYGIQFHVEKNSKEDLIRIYNSKKKGVTLDTSQIKNKVIERDILICFGLTESEDEDAEKKEYKFHSICIGINEFNDDSFPNLNYAKNDAVKLDKLIKDRFKEEGIKICLTDKQSTKKEILNSFNKIKNTANIEDTVFIFIATHGEFIQKDSSVDYYIIPHDIKDGNQENIIDSSIPMEEIKKIIYDIKAERKIIFIDTCYSGGMSRRDKHRV
ncbi:MAG: caspase family protein, partial [Candidatus Pacearchaeota archaeon]|nr:caspase family protein [Candidatus Pacearchaeota archaeon]